MKNTEITSCISNVHVVSSRKKMTPLPMPELASKVMPRSIVLTTFRTRVSSTKFAKALVDLGT